MIPIWELVSFSRNLIDAAVLLSSNYTPEVAGGPTMTIKNLQNKIYLLYHGDPSVKGSIGYLESLPAEGKGSVRRPLE